MHDDNTASGTAGGKVVPLALRDAALAQREPGSCPLAESAGLRLHHAGGLGGFRDDGGLHVPIEAGFRGKYPHAAVIGQWAHDIHEAVDKVSVALSPPQKHHVDDFISIVLKQHGADEILNGFAQCRVTVFVPTDFLDQQPLLEFEILHVDRSGVLSGAFGVCRSDQVSFLLM